MTDDILMTLPPNAYTTVSIETGDRLFNQGDKATGLYKVIAGEIVMQRINKDGYLLVVHRARSGEYFAEASIFSDDYHCDAECAKAGVIKKVSKQALLDRIATDQQFSLAFSKLLAKQIQKSRAVIEITAIRSSKERVLSAIYQGLFDSTVVELASRINLSHEACYRALRTLCNEKRLIHVGRGEYVVPSSV